LYVIHNVYPAGQADNLQRKIITTKTIASRHFTKSRKYEKKDQTNVFTSTRTHTDTRHLPQSASQNISTPRTTAHPEYYTLYLPSPRD